MGIVRAVCVSEKRGTAKSPVEQAEFVPRWGIEGDAHGGNWHRQVSLLSAEKIEEFRQKGAQVEYGAFGENLVVEGFDLGSLPIGTRFRCGSVLLEMTQRGKECHSRCEIYHRMGDCIMPREGVFAVVLEGGSIHEGDRMELEPAGVYETLADRNPNIGCVLATVLTGEHKGEKKLWQEDRLCWESSTDTLPEGRENRISAISGSGIVEWEGEQVFLEKIGSRKQLVICGAGHVSLPVIDLAKKLDFYVTVMDDRPFFASGAKRAGADEVICDSFSQAMAQIEGNPDTYFVIVTRGHRYDTQCLRLALQKTNAYIGMMGSRRRVSLVKEQLREEGFATEELEKVHTPIGLAIGAQTPEEIAVSIMAEIIQEKNRNGSGSTYSKELLSKLSGKEKTEEGIGVLCTIISRKGSAPREIGTKMLIEPDGRIVGTIGGGCAESSVINQGLSMLRTKENKLQMMEVNMTAEEAEEEGMVCGGIIRVMLEML